MEERNAFPFRTQALLSIAISVVALLIMYSPWGEALSRLGYDYLFYARGEIGSPEEIVIVAVDEDSMGELNLGWPWPRSLHARLVDELFKHGARVVAFDILFAEPSRVEEEDQTFASAVDTHKQVVFVSHVDTVYNEIGFLQDVIVEPESIREKLETPLRAGFDNVHIDADGAVRKLFLTQKGEAAFSVKAAEAYLGDSAVFKGALEKEELVWVNFLGARGTIRTVSYYQALSPSEYLPEGFFQDKLVLVGRALSSQVDADNPAVDHYAAPYSRFEGGLMPGVEIHANITFNILANLFIKPFPRNLTALAGFGIGVLGGILFLRLRLVPSLFLFSFLLIAFSASALYAFTHWLSYLDFVLLLAPLVGAYLLSPLANYLLIQRQRNFIRKAFSTYLAPELVQRLINNPDELELGGEVVEGTVLFLDMAGFTTLSEKVSAKELIEVINRNLGRFAEIILKWDGMIDKYIGDCIMAVWGVPLTSTDHAERTCRAVLEMRQAALVLAETEARTTGAKISVRIGVNSGTMVAGNVGGGQKFNYTVLGHEVNLAARLEGANKQYKTAVLISEATKNMVDSIFEFRRIDTIRVVGQKTPTGIFELLSEKGKLSAEAQELREKYEAALSAYSAREWAMAGKLFISCLELSPQDGPSSVFLARCSKFELSPPPDDWDGVYSLETK